MRSLFITVANDGKLYCYCPEDRYHYVVSDWTTFINNTNRISPMEFDQWEIFVATFGVGQA